jgi:hypothetical protein
MGGKTMNRQFDQALGRQGLSRRRFARQLATFGLGLISIPVISRSAQAADDLQVFDWSG